jgi:hypothetical protein
MAARKLEDFGVFAARLGDHGDDRHGEFMTLMSKQPIDSQY